MPKDILKITDFSGGINKAASKRDIEDNQLEEANNVDVSTAGIIRSGGTALATGSTAASITTAAPAGYGLFNYSHDYRDVDDKTQLIQNNSFASGSNWTLTTDFSITSGELRLAGTGAATRTATTSGGLVETASDDGTGCVHNDAKYFFRYNVVASTATNITSIKLKGTAFTETSAGVALSQEVGEHCLILTAVNNIESITETLQFEAVLGGSGGVWNISQCELYLLSDNTFTDYTAVFDTGQGNFDIYGGGITAGWRVNGEDWDGNNFGWSSSSTTHKPIVILQDGNLRISDANFSNSNVPRWRGYIDRPLITSTGNALSTTFCNGRLPGFYNYDAYIEPPTQSTSEAYGFNTSDGAPGLNDDVEQIGLRISYVSTGDADMIMGAGPDSTANGSGDTAYAVNGDAGGGTVSTTLWKSNALNGTGMVQDNYPQGTVGENVAESSSANHDADEGYYLFPKTITWGSDSTGYSLRKERCNILPFYGDAGQFKINWAAGDYFAFEIKGFSLSDNSWDDVIVNGTEGFYILMGIMGNTMTTSQAVRVTTQDHYDDMTGVIWRYVFIPASWSNDGEWHKVSFYDDSYITGSGDVSDKIAGINKSENRDWFAWEKIHGNYSNFQASISGVGRGIWLAISSSYDMSPPTINHDFGDGEGTVAARWGGFKEHSSNQADHIGFRNFRIERASGAGNSIGGFTFWYSWLYDDNKIESALTKINHTNKLELYENSAFKMKVYIKRKGSGNKRITGARIYYSQDNDISKFMMAEIDMLKGYKKVGDEDFTALTASSTTDPYTYLTGYIDFHGDNGAEWKNSIVTYTSNIGSMDTFKKYRYKTALVLNRRLYIGNVAEINDSGEVVKVMGDRILKSNVNQFDRFPENNFMEVAINDGDEVVHLEHFADRILIFKRHNLFVVNISQDVEFIENQFKHMGVKNSSQVCATELGVLWGNSRGLFLYDGNKINNLILGRLEESDFITTSNETNVPSVGYDSINKKIIIIPETESEGSAANDGWMFCLKTFSFVKLVGHFTNYTSSWLTNFSTDISGNLLYANGNNIYKWSDAATNNLDGISTNDKTFSFITKDFDFGDPAVRNKIYKIYVTYKTTATGTSNSCVYLTYAVDGSGSFGAITTLTGVANYTGTGTTNGLLDTNGEFKVAEIKPSSSLTVKSLQLKFENLSVATANTEGIEITDISIVFRNKTTK